MGPAAMTVLCLVEQDAGEAADASLRALTFAARLAGAGPAGPVPVAASAHVVEPGDLDGYAPRAWAHALAGLAARTEAVAVVAAATERGNEVLAYLGALTG